MHLFKGDDCFGVRGLRDDAVVEKLDRPVAYGAELTLDLCFEGGGSRPPLEAGPVTIGARLRHRGMRDRRGRPRPPGVS